MNVQKRMMTYSYAQFQAGQPINWPFDITRINVLQIRRYSMQYKIIGGTKTNYWQLTKLNISDY